MQYSDKYKEQYLKNLGNKRLCGALENKTNNRLLPINEINKMLNEYKKEKEE